MKTTLSCKRALLLTGFALCYFLFCSRTLYAAETRAVTVLSANNSMGVVSCTANNTSFSHYTYLDAYGYVKATALPVNTRYSFSYWTDNGVIVSRESTYSFSPGNRDRVVIAHFDVKYEERKGHHDTDDNIDSIKAGTAPCTFAPGYRLDGMTINTSLIVPDSGSQSAAEALSGGTFGAAVRILFTYGFDGAPKEKLDSTVRLTLTLPASCQRTGRYFRIVDLSGQTPVVQEDLDDSDKTVTFPAQKGGAYILTYSDSPFPASGLTIPAADLADAATPSVDAASALPDASTAPAAIPAIPAVASPPAPVSDEEYSLAIITILRRQLQDAGISPLA